MQQEGEHIMSTHVARYGRFLPALAAIMAVAGAIFAPAPPSAAAASSAALSAPAHGRGALRIIDLGTFSKGVCCSEANGINNRGQVVGGSHTKSGSFHAFLWYRGTMRDLDTLGDQYSTATAVNDGGTVVGYGRHTATGALHAFLWYRGTMHDLGTLGGQTSFATAVNDHGTVVGFRTTASGAFHAFLWYRGKMRDLGGMEFAYGINNHGDVVGAGFSAHLVVWRNGRIHDLGVAPGFWGVTSVAINDQGQIAGTLIGPYNRAFFWQHGHFTLLNLPNSPESQAVAINDCGQVVGVSGAGSNTGFVWQAGAYTELPGLIKYLSQPNAINDHGQIAGIAATGSANVNGHAVLWTR